ncbi:sucrose:sucrose 1-fructosyltransferase-like [Triticum dicoccoides]|uniref:sucrose:sucrose 1-fructosyltransferase-like n=1 Tax=Triticum dicoccoides TaxID=85692 RepID=UPI00188FBE5F|nr:sucrose:sucrose 1-fructosyltransferase-like [Triticum dicoccoides]
MESHAVPSEQPAYKPLPSTANEDAHEHQGGGVRWRACAAVLAASAVVLVAATTLGRGARVDEAADEDAGGFPWSNEMLQWQRAAFHFQPEKNFMSDPNGLVYYRGWYHLFYQYNPKGIAWAFGILWGHAASRDLVHWRQLPLAVLPDQWYDIQGVLSGSITVLPNGTLIMLYTGATNVSTVEVQCVAVPEDPNDPLLRRWTKHPANPVLSSPPWISTNDFRDPTSAWYDGSDHTWRTVLGSKDDHNGHHAGIAFMYKTKDFLHYELVPGILHRVENTGEWECIDFYPVGGGDNSSQVLYVLKASMDDERHDYYSLGRYDAAANTWTPVDPEADLGIGLRYDWGKLYASSSFYDPVKRRRIMMGYVGEVDSVQADVAKGWASIQSVPRTVALDEKTRTNLLLWPVEEIETLRLNATELSDITIETGSVFHVPLRQADQLDIEASFRLDASAITALNEADIGYNCSSSGGAASRGALGPFGLIVLASSDRCGEQTAVYFYVSRGLDGALQTSFCQDESRSSRARDVTKRVVGSTVPVLDGEALSMRVLVDHSIVQSFAMGGRCTVTSRVYPMEAIYEAAGVYLFNNTTNSSVMAERLVVHEMDSAPNEIITDDKYLHFE